MTNLIDKMIHIKLRLISVKIVNREFPIIIMLNIQINVTSKIKKIIYHKKNPK